MNDAFGIILLALSTGVCWVALVFVLTALFTRRVERTALVAVEMPGRSLTLGLINGLFFTAVIIGFLAADQALGIQLLAFPALATLALVLAGMAFGLSGLSILVGRRALADSSRLRQRIVGSASLYLACLTPIIGWFGLLPAAALFGLGAFLLSFFTQTSAPRPPETTATTS